MGLIQEQEGLTVIDPNTERLRRATYPGMAHFAGTGPKGKTCRECVFWTNCGLLVKYYSKSGMYGGTIKPLACAKYKELMRGEIGPAVPHDASACKYFAETATPYPITERRS